MKENSLVFTLLHADMKHWLILGVLLFTLMSSCAGGSARKASDADTLQYAKLLNIQHGKGYTLVEVINPWKTNSVLAKYVLVRSADSLPDSLPQGTLIRTPLKRAVVYSSVHIGVFKELQSLDAVKGVCDSKYISMPEIKTGIASGNITDIGESLSPNVERIVDMNPDAILLSPFENAGVGAIENLGIPIIQCADYMEQSPLGRAEWIRFFGLLLDNEQFTDSVFNHEAETYNNMCMTVSKAKTKPKVITENLYGSVWYVPGGKSYMARMLDDAGASYPWSDNNDSGSLALDFAKVLDTAQDADIWLIKYSAPKPLSYSSWKGEYELYSHFDAFKKHHIWGCNTMSSSLYEDFPFHPSILLREYSIIFHPELFPSEQTSYFKPLEI